MFWRMKRPTPETHAIAAYWDAQVRQHPAVPVPPAGLPASHGAMIRQLHVEEASGSLPAYQDALLQRLLATYEETDAMNATTATAVPSPPGSSRTLPPRRPISPPFRAIPALPRMRMAPTLNRTLQVALVLLLILASIAGIWLANDRNQEPRIIAPGTATPTAEASPDVPMYRGDPARTGVFTGPGIDGDPVLRWTVQSESQIHSAPAIVDGVLYIGAADRSLIALDAISGEQLWAYPADNLVFSSPAVANGIVYAGDDAGKIYAVRAADGTELWSASGYRGSAQLLPVGNVLYASSDEGSLVALDGATGEELWRHALGGGATRAPVLADGVVFICDNGQGQLHAIDANTGDPIWDFQAEGGGLLTTTAVANGLAYQGSFLGEVNYLDAVDVRTGEKVWSFSQPASAGYFPPAVSDDLVFLPSADSHVYALDAATGELRWTFETGGAVSAAPALVGDTLYVASNDGNVYAVNASDGTEDWRFAIEGGVDYGPVVSAGMLYVGTSLGTLYAIGGSNSTPGEAALIVLPARTDLDAATPPAEPAATPEDTDSIATFRWMTKGGDVPFAQPSDITIAPDGTIWVSNGERGVIEIFNPDGTFIETWGTPGSRDGQFNFQRLTGDGYGGVAFAPDGSFYVVDSGNQRVQHFDANRTWLGSWGQYGTDDGEFLSPIGIGVDTQGNVYVVDDYRSDVQKFDADGTFLMAFGGFGSDPGQLAEPGFLAIAPDDTIWVADPGNQRIEQWDADGTFLQAIDTSATVVVPMDLAIDAEGHLFIADFEGSGVVVLDPAGNITGEWSASGPGLAPLELVNRIAIDQEGNVYISELLANRVTSYHVELPPLPAATPVATPAT